MISKQCPKRSMPKAGLNVQQKLAKILTNYSFLPVNWQKITTSKLKTKINPAVYCCNHSHTVNPRNLPCKWIEGLTATTKVIETVIIFQNCAKINVDWKNCNVRCTNSSLIKVSCISDSFLI